MTTPTFPFELPKAAKFFIAVNPVICAAMTEGTKEEKAAIAAIAPKLERRDGQPDSPWGFYIRRNFGLSFTEKSALAAASEVSRESNRKMLALLRKISEDTKKPLADIQAQADLGAVGADWILPYADELLDVSKEMQLDPTVITRATLLLKRTFPCWANTATKALHSRILEQVIEFDKLEQVGEIERAEPETSEKAEELGEDSPE